MSEQLENDISECKLENALLRQKQKMVFLYFTFVILFIIVVFFYIIYSMSEYYEKESKSIKDAIVVKQIIIDNNDSYVFENQEKINFNIKNNKLGRTLYINIQHE